MLYYPGGEVYPDEAKQISGTQALGTKPPFRSNFEGFLLFEKIKMPPRSV
jgi:hypothetical protein